MMKYLFICFFIIVITTSFVFFFMNPIIIQSKSISRISATLKKEETYKNTFMLFYALDNGDTQEIAWFVIFIKTPSGESLKYVPFEKEHYFDLVIKINQKLIPCSFNSRSNAITIRNQSFSLYDGHIFLIESDKTTQASVPSKLSDDISLFISGNNGVSFLIDGLAKAIYDNCKNVQLFIDRNSNMRKSITPVMFGNSSVKKTKETSKKIETNK